MKKGLVGDQAESHSIHMMPQRSSGVGTLMPILVITVLLSTTSSYPLTLKKVSRNGERLIAFGESNDESFEQGLINCICDTTKCGFKYYYVDANEYPEKSSQVISAEGAAAFNKQKYFTCNETENNTISCEENNSRYQQCIKNRCTVNLIFTCSSWSQATLVFDTQYKLSVNKFNGVKAVDCCLSNQTPSTLVAITIATSPHRSIATTASPRRYIATTTSSRRPIATTASPRRYIATTASSRRHKATQTSPRRHIVTKSSPRRSITTKTTSPRRSIKTKTTPPRKRRTIKTTSTRRSIRTTPPSTRRSIITTPPSTRRSITGKTTSPRRPSPKSPRRPITTRTSPLSTVTITPSPLSAVTTLTSTLSAGTTITSTLTAVTTTSSLSQSTDTITTILTTAITKENTTTKIDGENTPEVNTLHSTPPTWYTPSNQHNAYHFTNFETIGHNTSIIIGVVAGCILLALLSALIYWKMKSTRHVNWDSQTRNSYNLKTL